MHLLLAFGLFAQSELLQQKIFADKLFASEKYFDAITEYKRLQFFDKKNMYVFESNLNIGVSYKQGGKYNNAIKYLSLAVKNSDDIEQKYFAKTEIIRANILRKTTSRAIELLTELESDTIYLTKLDEIYYWKGWAYIFSDDFKNASIEFAKIDNNHQLKKLCYDVVNQKYSVNFAKTISYIVPGSGHIYTGNYVQGLLSLGWNVLWGYMTVNSFIQDRALDGILVGSLLWLRFYKGSNQSAERLAIEKNLEISNKALLYLQNNYKGLKP